MNIYEFWDFKHEPIWKNQRFRMSAQDTQSRYAQQHQHRTDVECCAIWQNWHETLSHPCDICNQIFVYCRWSLLKPRNKNWSRVKSSRSKRSWNVINFSRKRRRWERLKLSSGIDFFWNVLWDFLPISWKVKIFKFMKIFHFCFDGNHLLIRFIVTSRSCLIIINIDVLKTFELSRPSKF